MGSVLVFPRGWYATDLGSYRPCQGTYEAYAYESLPPLDPAQLRGRFDWLGPPGPPDEDGIALLAPISAALATMSLALPDDFVRFVTSSNYRLELDEASVTGSWSDIAGPTRSPAEPGAALVRIFSDQQYCASWYIYLRASGETFVVFDVDPYPAEPAYPNLEDSILLNGDFSWCAGSFEEFAYRYWIENRLCEALHADLGTDLTSDLDRYLDHYRS
ncbi:hypothetical protein [Rhizocola hellebori]|uniref:hypothetical protein n=1 Tax=Rhizocola hellebori TaxID=1392758 RepID=UPI001940536E|nr:hypothetical protein [Rhizocola hellebori]